MESGNRKQSNTETDQTKKNTTLLPDILKDINHQIDLFAEILVEHLLNENYAEEIKK